MVVLYCYLQAEDGMRYADVTGVQTCALPIFGMGGLLVVDAEPRQDDIEDEETAHPDEPEDQGQQTDELKYVARRRGAHRADADGAQGEKDREAEEESRRSAPMPATARGEPAKDGEREQREGCPDQDYRRGSCVRDTVP